jgi:hypothetical protein
LWESNGRAIGQGFGPSRIKQGAKLVAGWEDVVEKLPTPVRAELLAVEQAGWKKQRRW